MWTQPVSVKTYVAYASYLTFLDAPVQKSQMNKLLHLPTVNVSNIEDLNPKKQQETEIISKCQTISTTGDE